MLNFWSRSKKKNGWKKDRISGRRWLEHLVFSRFVSGERGGFSSWPWAQQVGLNSLTRWTCWQLECIQEYILVNMRAFNILHLPGSVCTLKYCSIALYVHKSRCSRRSGCVVVIDVEAVSSVCGFIALIVWALPKPLRAPMIYEQDRLWERCNGLAKWDVFGLCA